ncbi:MAG: hypothetical protein ACR2RB_03465 [Gammaproteobacteria bacterium]
MKHTITGQCHCGNVSFELSTSVPVSGIEARACDCSFCRVHGAQNWTDANGSATIRVKDSNQLQRYLFALRTAEFLICTTCGAYAGAVFSDSEGTWSTVNLRLTGLSGITERTASFGGEQTSERIARRKRLWTPTKLVGV